MTQNTRTPRTTTHRPTRTPARAFGAVALALAVALTAGTADARAGKSSSMGSRGSRTYEAPATTNTAPNAAAPMERSMASPGMQQQRPGMGAAAPAAQSGGFFSRGGFLPGLMGGLIGAGIGGMLFGSGFFDGIGSFAGILGFILQILLVVFLVRLAIRFFRNRSAGAARPMGMSMGNGMGAPGTAYAGPTQAGPTQASPLNRDPADVRYNPVGGGLGGGGAAPAGRPGVRRDDVGIGPADYEAFEKTLVTVQTAYGNEDLAALRSATTPEMNSYFAEELAQNNGRGVVNKLSDVRLLQGDLAEAWREGNMEYATVAMRFSLVDVTVDRATNRVVDGDPNRPVEATELWTFTRSRGGRWLLSAIQQTR
ncbi:Tim44 domain-containing protein [Azospirillum rugosum]|uniref:Lipid-binding transport protein (Tim44 family) n=1 Tax=Azospirillum rugosum TaxID=416170 RepID=A0ABS4SNV0_9PROT|nr:Tim44 domain-containing protein [Azospirillum rugosum]MBP2293035.1 putative lipid-binding transport protein (Tim44 family) [Azospirillum rugosum]MDQ0526584.1 putative lipid-binding transport protein (Tim44 family) [Azospirillum rugosum]